MICSACNIELVSGDAFLECAVADCTKVYHYLCNNRQLTLEERATWVCPECCCAARKGARNDELPISVNTPIILKNVSARNKSHPPPPLSPPSPGGSPFATGLEMQQLREQINVLTEQLTDAVSTIAQYHIALTDCTKKIETCNEKLHKLEQTRECTRCLNISPGIPTPLESVNLNNRQLYSHISKPKIPNPTKIKHHSSPENNQKLVPPTSTISVQIENDFSDTHSQPINSTQPIGPVTETVHLDDHEEVPSPTADDNVANEKWVEVRNRKSKRYNSVRGTAGPEITPLKAVEFRKYVHLWNMMSGAADIQSYLQKLCSTGNCTVEELKPKGDYKSFKIGVPAEFFEKATAADTWPTNARVKEWFFRRLPNKLQARSSSGQQETKPAN